MWLLNLLCCILFVFTSGFPTNDITSDNIPEHFHVQLLEYGEHPTFRPYQKTPICLPAPFIGQMCLPSPMTLIPGIYSHDAGRQRCFSVPFMRAYSMKFCAPNKPTSKEENINTTQKEVIKEVIHKTGEPIFNIEVNGVKGYPENFVKNEQSVETQDLKVQENDAQSKNKMMEVSQEVVELKNLEPPPEAPFSNIHPLDIQVPRTGFDENINISANLV